MKAAVLLMLASLLAACGSGPTLSTAPPSANPAVSARPTPVRTPATSAGAHPTSTPAASDDSGLVPTGPTEAAKVVRVVDGDTIVVDRGRGKENLRYIGMDTPESVKPGSPVEWYATEASKENVRLVSGKNVVLEKDVSETDQYGRLLRDVWLHSGDTWSLVNLTLVEEGFARVSTFPPDVKYVDQLLAAERSAREAERGLWGPGPLDFVSPTDGSTVTTSTITVAGTAAPGARVVEDIPQGLDRDTIAADDGSWQLVADLKKGKNLLKFRIDNEKATTRTLQVIYKP
jgi:micrococcal nuclease